MSKDPAIRVSAGAAEAACAVAAGAKAAGAAVDEAAAAAAVSSFFKKDSQTSLGEAAEDDPAPARAASGAATGDACCGAVAGWAGEAAGVEEGSVRSAMAESVPPGVLGDGIREAWMLIGGRFGIGAVGIGAPVTGSGGVAGDAGGGDNGTCLGVGVAAADVPGGEAAGAVGAMPADFDVVATAVGLGSTGGEPPTGGGEIMAGGGRNMCGGKGGCSDAGGKDCRASTGWAAGRVVACAEEAAAVAGKTPGTTGRATRDAGTAEVAGPGAARLVQKPSSSATPTQLSASAVEVASAAEASVGGASPAPTEAIDTVVIPKRSSRKGMRKSQ